MKRKLITIVLAAMCAALALSLTACNKTTSDKNTTYTINATMDSDKLLTVQMRVDYVNNYDVPLDNVAFHLYMQAFREDAKILPYEDDMTASVFGGTTVKNYSTLFISRVAVSGSEQSAIIEGEDDDILKVVLESALEPTKSVTIEIDYTLQIPKTRHRLGWYGSTVNLADFFPIACVYSDGGFDTRPYYAIGDPFYSECSDYSVTLTAPSSYTNAAMSGTVSETARTDEQVTFTSQIKNARTFAIVMGEGMQKISASAGAVKVNYLYTSDSDAEGSLKTATDSINTFSQMYGAYPYDEYTVVSTPFIYGGMEYPALSMINSSSTGSAQDEIIIHETAHQWWYGIVGNDQISNAWMDEALAEYSTMRFYESNEGYDLTYADKLADSLGAYMLYCETVKKKDGSVDTSFNRAVNEYESMTEYNYMVYVKGSLMFAELKTRIGADTVDAALKKYVSTYKFKNATCDDLIGAFESASKTDLKGYFESWLSGNVKMYSALG